MASLRSNLIILLILTLGCIGAVEGGYRALEYFILDPRIRPETVTPKTSLADRARITPPVAVQGSALRDYRIITTRNLFGEAGLAKLPAQPPPPPPPPVEDIKPSTLNVTLMGTVDGEESSRRAFILDKTDNKQQFYEVGDYIGDALVLNIMRGKVIVQFNGAEEMLDMTESYKINRPAMPPTQMPNRPTIVRGTTDNQGAASPDPNQVVFEQTGNQVDQANQNNQARRVRPRVFRPTRRQ